MAEKERSSAILTAVIACIGTLGAAAIGGYFTLAANDHKAPQPKPPVTSPAPPPASSSPANPVDTVVAGPTSTTATATSSASSSVALQTATVSGVPRQAAPGLQVTLHGSGFPAGGTVQITFAPEPGQDYPMTRSPAQADSQGRFTFTFTVLDIFCGYDGAVNTYNLSGDRRLLTSNPLAVAC